MKAKVLMLFVVLVLALVVVGVPGAVAAPANTSCASDGCPTYHPQTPIAPGCVAHPDPENCAPCFRK